MTEAIKNRPRVFLDIQVGNVPLGRITFELFTDLAPKTAENFRALCTGEKGIGKTTEKPLHYLGSCFHRVVKDFMIQGGDFVNHNGTGGESIYGSTFDDEEFKLKHDRPFLLSMANRGRNTNGSQFFITTNHTPHLDNIHVIFGQVVGGKEVVKEINELEVDKKDRPLQDARIVNCGQLVKKATSSNKENKKKKKKRASSTESDSSSSSESSSDSDSSSDSKAKRKSKKKSKKRKKKKSKKPKQKNSEDENSASPANPLFEPTKIDKDEIPEVPRNRFLDRFGGEKTETDIGHQSKSNSKDRSDRRDRDRYDKNRHRDSHDGDRYDRDRYDRDRYDRSRHDREKYDRNNYDNSGKKVKGRGRMTYKPMSGDYRSRSRSRSITPPHWKNNRTITLSEYEKRKKDKERREIESNRRAELRRQRHEEQELEEKKRTEREEYHRKKEDRKKKDLHYKSDSDYDSKNDMNNENREKSSKEGYEAQSIMDPDFDISRNTTIHESKRSENKHTELEEGEHSDNERSRPQRRFTENKKSPYRRYENRTRHRSNSSENTDSSRSRASSSPSPVRRTNYKRRERSLSVNE